jgi:biopolymer transport protein ExbD
MAFGSFNPQRQESMMSDINVTPLVDVMLVLLVIFIIAAPMLTNAIRLDLPRARSAATGPQAATVSIAVDAAGTVFWNTHAVDAAELDAHLARSAAQMPQPELLLRADNNTRYELVAQLMAAAQSHGLTKLGFVTDPTKDKPPMEQVHGQR